MKLKLVDGVVGVGAVLGVLFFLMDGPFIGANKPLDVGHSHSSSDQSGEEINTDLNLKKSAEIFQEMIRVVYQTDPTTRAGDFSNWVDTLSQGASIEGIYRGISQSDFYRNLESTKRSASARALSVFGVELAMLEAELPLRTPITVSMTQPLMKMVEPSLEAIEVKDPILLKPENHIFSLVKLESDRDQVSQEEFNQKRQWIREKFVEKYSEGYSKAFVGASHYILKRVLSTEALKVIELQSEYQEKFALWYSNWVMDTLRHKIDYGLELRNKNDFKFHYSWALTASKDQQVWEVINRLHRIMNHYDSI